MTGIANHRVTKTRGKSFKHPKDCIDGLAFVIVVPCRLARQIAAKMLAKEACHMTARWCERIIDRTGNQHFHDRTSRNALVHCVTVGLLHPLQTGTHDDPACMVRSCFGLCAKARQSVQRKVHPETARLGSISRHRLEKIVRQGQACQQVVSQNARMRVAGNDFCVFTDARFKDYATNPSPILFNTSHRRITMKANTDLFASPGHACGDRTHSANGMTPLALFAIHATKAVVQQDISRTRHPR